MSRTSARSTRMSEMLYLADLGFDRLKDRLDTRRAGGTPVASPKGDT